MRTEPDFALRVELQEALIEELRVAREAELRQLLKEQGKVNYIQNMWSTPWVYASAAIVAGFLILFVVLKYYVPTNEYPLVQNTESVSDEGDPDEAPDQDLPQSEVQNNAVQSDTSTTGTADSLVPIVDEAPEMVEDEEVPAQEFAVKKTKNQDLTSLRKESDKIQVDDDVEVKRDKMLESRSVKVLLIGATTAKAPAAVEVETSSTETVSKKTKKGLFKKDKEETADDAAGEAVQAPSERILKVELWESNVNFKGYLWDKETLLLYDIRTEENLTFKEYNGQLYMKRGSKYYQLKRSAKFEGYVPLTDSAILKSLE